MGTISVRLNENEDKILREYVNVNNLNLSDFVRESILNRIEDDLDLDEQRIIRARERAKGEKTYSHEEVWDMLGV